MIIAILYFIVLLLDLILFITFRDLMFSFLLSKRNKKSALKIHKSQSFLDRLTFNYVEEQAIYKKQYGFFHSFYIVNLCFAPIQYILLATINFISLKATFILQVIIIVIKMIFNFILRLQRNDNRIFKFDKRYK